MAMNKKKFKAAAYANAVNTFKADLVQEAFNTYQEIKDNANVANLPTYITKCQVAVNKLSEALEDFAKAADIKAQLDNENT